MTNTTNPVTTRLRGIDAKIAAMANQIAALTSEVARLNTRQAEWESAFSEMTPEDAYDHGISPGIATSNEPPAFQYPPAQIGTNPGTHASEPRPFKRCLA